MTRHLIKYQVHGPLNNNKLWKACETCTHTTYSIITIIMHYNVWPELCTVGVDAKVSTQCQY